METLTSSTKGCRDRGRGGGHRSRETGSAPKQASIRLPAEPSVYARGGHFIAHKNDLLGV